MPRMTKQEIIDQILRDIASLLGRFPLASDTDIAETVLQFLRGSSRIVPHDPSST
jgi:hypothetical protein